MAEAGGGTEAGHRGLGASLRGVVTGLLGLAATHAELVGVEIQEEKERIAEIAVLGACAFAMFAMTLLLITLLIVVVLWDSYRVQSVVGLAILYGGLGAAALIGIRRKLAAHPNPFAATAAELAADRERLQS